VYWVDSSGRRNTIIRGGVYGQTGELDARVDRASGYAITWSSIAST
jgi:hypothetical protein